MPLVDDFRRQLFANATPMAAWHKIDLHNHSPASADFVGNRATALDDFAARIREQRLSAVMFTDHVQLPDEAFIKGLAEKTGALILAGLEVNVFVDAFGKPATKVGKELCFHLLIGFDPEGKQSPAYWKAELYRKCKLESRKFGSEKIDGIAASMEKIHETLKESGAFIIPAHLHTNNDAFKSRSVDDVVNDAEFLDWTRKYFTALDVRKDSTAVYFDGKHDETGRLEKTCIRSSDAHKAETLGTTPCWAQMEHQTFAELKAALELPSRISRSEPVGPLSHVLGLYVNGQFLRDHWMTLSPHLNVLIGVKGSGKTSILECIRFGLGTDVPAERQAEVERHLSAILGPAGVVKLLVKRDDGALILIERRVSDRKFHVYFQDDRHEIFDSPVAFRFSASVLGWHEIEHAATDKQIRRLHMDAIAGRDEIKRLTETARNTANSISQPHANAAAKYAEYRNLVEAVKAQEAMRAGLQQLQDANLIGLRDQMSSGLADKQRMQQLREHLRNLPQHIPVRVQAVMQIDQFQFGSVPPLAEIGGMITTELSALRDAGHSFRDRVTELSAQKLAAIETLLKTADERFEQFSADYRARLSKLPPDVQRLLESHRDVLEKTKELPNLRARLEQLKVEIDQLLANLAELAEQVAITLDQRTTLRTTRVREFNALLSDSGVTLAVVGGVARADEFAAAFSSHAASRDVFQQIHSWRPSERFHRTLAATYQELRGDLNCGFRVMFSTAETGHLLSVLEEDDLDIRFAVGKPGEQFSPIDQLSAGQRCTAVFPILLKLKEGPLVVDQPEDNLDNRHIAKNVAPVMVADKRVRQILLTSHNANLVVLSDPECIAVFEAEGGQGKRAVAGFLSHRQSSVTSSVLDILDGGERALELRSKKYGAIG